MIPLAAIIWRELHSSECPDNPCNCTPEGTSEALARALAEALEPYFQEKSYIEGYESGYSDGESNLQADWDFALDEHCDLPSDVPNSPTEVALYIRRTQDELDPDPEYTPSQEGHNEECLLCGAHLADPHDFDCALDPLPLPEDD